MLNKIDLLFIRACKSKDPIQRVGSVYTRFYLPTEPDHAALLSILERICAEYLPIKTHTLLTKLAPSQDWMYHHLDDVSKLEQYHYRACQVLTFHIRHSDVKGIEGYIPPRMFRQPVE